MALKDVIKDARIKKGLKQEDAAKSVGVTVQTYSKWENGKTEPRASQVALLAQSLGLSEMEICRGEMNQRYSLEEFIEASEAARKSHIADDVQEAVLLWRFLDDHKGYLLTLAKAYQGKPHAHAAMLEKMGYSKEQLKELESQ